MPKTIDDGDYLFGEDMNSIVSGLGQKGIVEGFAVSPDSPVSMDVIVAEGKGYVNDKPVSTDATQTITITAAHATLNRIDLVTLDEDGAVAVVTGTAATNPIPPLFSSQTIVLATIDVAATVVTITAADINDERILVKHQLYKMPWLSEVETGGDVQLFDDNNTATESNWIRVVNPDYTISSTGEYIISNGLIRIQTRLREGSNQARQYLYVVEDRDYDADGICELNQNFYYISWYPYIDSVAWAVDNLIPVVTPMIISPDKVKLRLRYSGSSRIMDQFITLNRGERFVTVEFEVIQLAPGDTVLTDIVCGCRDPTNTPRFTYRDISVGDKFSDAYIATTHLTGDGDNLNRNYQIIYTNSATSPFVYGYATDRMSSHVSEGAFVYYSANVWPFPYGRETGLTVASGDVPIVYYLFGYPFPDLDHLFKEGEVTAGAEFGRTDLVGTWVSVANGVASGGFYLTNDDAFGGSSAQNDEVRYDFYIPRTGFYDVWINSYNDNTGAIATVQLDDVAQGTIDTYAAVGAWTYGSVENIYMTRGRHNIDFKLATKNPLSIDFELKLDCIYIVPKYQEVAFAGDLFPDDMARQAISTNEFSYGYNAPLNFDGILDTTDVTNDWSFSAIPVAIAPVGVTSSSETIDYYRYARKRYVDNVGTQDAFRDYTVVSGTWSVETGYGDDTGNSMSCIRHGAEIEWDVNFPRKGWYLAETHIRESDDGTDDKYAYFLRNVSVSGAYSQFSLDHMHDMDSSQQSIRWSLGEVPFYVERGDQTVRLKIENTSGTKVVDEFKFYPVDPVPVIGTPVTPTEITFVTNLISDVPHSRLDGINQMDSLQADKANLTYVDMSGHVDMNQQEILEPVIENRSVAPTSPVPGQLYFDVPGSLFRGWTGSQWRTL